MATNLQLEIRIRSYRLNMCKILLCIHHASINRIHLPLFIVALSASGLPSGGTSLFLFAARLFPPGRVRRRHTICLFAAGLFIGRHQSDRTISVTLPVRLTLKPEIKEHGLAGTWRPGRKQNCSTSPPAASHGGVWRDEDTIQAAGWESQYILCN